MVHALKEIERTLVPHGLLIDLRPYTDRWPVEIAWGKEHLEAGRLTDLPEGLADDEAANRAMEEAEKNGWFKFEKGERFYLYYSWDTARDMQEWIDEEWDGFIRLEEGVARAVRSAWAIADADARVRVRASMLIDKWRCSRQA